MRRLLKFLHTMGAVGLMGGTAALLVMMSVAPPASSLAGYAAVREAMGAVADWVYMPSLMVTLVAGLLAIAASPAYQNAGWAWVKLVSGVLIFEGGMIGVQGPIEEEAKRSAAALAGHLDAAAQAAPGGTALWALLAVMTANVALGIWRPRIGRMPA